MASAKLIVTWEKVQGGGGVEGSKRKFSKQVFINENTVFKINREKRSNNNNGDIHTVESILY